jgi:3-oxoacyl-[acyl-carrier protein] reductase
MPNILITGGTRGIGLALAESFAQKGWKVAVCYHQDEASAQTAREKLASYPVPGEVLRCDVSQGEPVEEMIQGLMDRWGILDAVIHNAGATWNARIPNIDEAQWEDTLGVHLKGAFLVSQAAIKTMLKQKEGHLIFISSVAATTGNIGQGSYTAAKAGVIGLAKSVAREYGSKNIKVNVVCPGFHKTKLAEGLSPEAEQTILEKHLLGKTTDLKEVREFVVWLAGTQTISGQVFNLDSRLPGWL